MIHQYYPVREHDFEFELNKEVLFAASHFIPRVEAGKCQNRHGHNYVVNLTICGDVLNECGFLVDFRTLKHLIEKEYDHTELNDHADFSGNNYPSTETIAKVICDKVNNELNQLPHKPICIQVLVRETPEAYAIYRPRGNLRNE